MLNLDTGSTMVLMLMMLMAIQAGMTWAWVAGVLLLLFVVKSKGLVMLGVTGGAVFLMIKLGADISQYWWVIMLALVVVLIFLQKKEPGAAGMNDAYMQAMMGGYR